MDYPKWPNTSGLTLCVQNILFFLFILHLAILA